MFRGVFACSGVGQWGSRSLAAGWLACLVMASRLEAPPASRPFAAASPRLLPGVRGRPERRRECVRRFGAACRRRREGNGDARRCPLRGVVGVFARRGGLRCGGGDGGAWVQTVWRTADHACDTLPCITCTLSSRLGCVVTFHFALAPGPQHEFVFGRSSARLDAARQ